MAKGIHKFRTSSRKGEANKQKLMNTRYGVIPKPKVRKRKK